MRRPDAQGIPIARIVLADDLRGEGTAVFEAGEIARSPQPKPLIEPLPEMPVAALDEAVLMGDPAVVARRFHPAVGAQRLAAGAPIASGVLPGVGER